MAVSEYYSFFLNRRVSSSRSLKPHTVRSALLEFKRTTECVYLSLWGTCSGNETLSKRPEVVSSELELMRGIPGRVGLERKRLRQYYPAGEAATGSPPGLEG